MSTGERPFLDIVQDRRYWLIHVVTIPCLYLSGVVFVGSSFAYKLFGKATSNMNLYETNVRRHISLINDRFSGFNEITDY